VVTNTRFPASFHTVTFDCWATLIHEVDGGRAPKGRTRSLAQCAGIDESPASAALQAAWRRHQVAWHQRMVFDGPDMTRHALEALGIALEGERLAHLVSALESQILEHEIRAIDGARELLLALRGMGVRRALICDTGFTPGWVVRKLLDRVGLLELLEVTVFSNEVGFPKPHARPFDAALSALGTRPHGALHVGDLRRSDVAGARAAGMSSVRFRGRHDDSDQGVGANAGFIDCNAAGCEPRCPRPEADAVVDSYGELAALLGIRSSAAP
jgi:putative hydrolase of the HAD superfamily